MTLERILSKKLKTFLKESFPGSVVTNNLKPGFIKSLIKTLDKNFTLSVFTMTTDASPEDILSFCEMYYFERDWLKQSERIVDIKHNGMDLSFERDNEKLFVILSPFEKFVQITIVTFNN